MRTSIRLAFNWRRSWGALFAAVLVLACGESVSQSGTSVEQLRIAVYGASGRTGSVIVREALARGHQVTGIGRNPDSITEQHENLSVARGDILDAQGVLDLIAGYDVVINAVRGANTDSGDPENSVTVLATRNLVAALRSLGGEAPRMLMVGGGSSLEPGAGYEKWSDGSSEQVHRTALAYLRTVTDVEWTCLSPPMGRMGGIEPERTGRYRVGGDVVLRTPDGEYAPISRQDLAVAMLDEIEEPKHIRSRFTVAY